MPFTANPPRARLRRDSFGEPPPRRESEIEESRRYSQLPPEYDLPVNGAQPFDPGNSYASGRGFGPVPERRFNVFRNDTENDVRSVLSIPQEQQGGKRGSADSAMTLTEEDNIHGDLKDPYGSYKHPYEIQPPHKAQGGMVPPGGDPEYGDYYKGDGKDFKEDAYDIEPAPEERRRGFLGNLLALQGLDEDEDGDGTVIRGFHIRNTGLDWGHRTIDDLAPEEDQVIDPDDPILTGARKTFDDDDPNDIEKNVLQNMSYRERRKEAQRMRIQYNVTSLQNRQQFIMKLARALMTFGAPSHRIESQLLSAARILELDAEFIHIPGVIICSFGDHETKTSETHFVKCGGRLALGSLHQVHKIYRSVVHDEVSALQAAEQLEEVINAPPIYNAWIRCILAFFISALICPLAFGGSIVDLGIAGIGAVGLCLTQIITSTKSQIYANTFEITATICISFFARGLSTIPGYLFCYTAISSSSIVSILPGYLILSSSLELASKNIVCGSVKMVYALIYTLFLGFGLQIGNDLYLLFYPKARNDLVAQLTRNQDAFTLTGTFIPDNEKDVYGGFVAGALTGGFSFTTATEFHNENVILGCYRFPDAPFYLQKFPWWSQFVIVPIFSILSSLSNLQPWKTLDMVVMVIISCVSYASNKLADHFIFRRSDVVSAIGAFSIGVLGNFYSRRMGGTAFTSMVTGVLFLVPSGLSQAGGITAQGNGIDIGNAMIAVTIGITVGLFMSQALVYMFGTRKSAAMFSF